MSQYLGCESQKALDQALEGAGLLYQHPQLGSAVASLLAVEPAEATLGGVLHQSLMRLENLTYRPEIFRWNPETEVTVEPISLRLDSRDGGESLELDLRLRSKQALLPGAHCPEALLCNLRQQGNLWWSYGKGEDIDGREHDSMKPQEEADWAEIIAQMRLSRIEPIQLVRVLDEFADCAIDFRYSDAFLQSMAQTLSTPMEYLEAWQAEGDGVIVDVSDEKIQGFC